MIPALIIIGLAFTWLLYETDWMQVRLLAGKEIPRNKLKMTISEWERYDKIHAKEIEQLQKEHKEQQIARACRQQSENKQKVEKTGRKWQFAKYGDDCLMMRDRCYIEHCNLCRQGDRFFAWRIPARNIKLFGSTINLKAGCNLYRAKLLKDIAKAQKSKALPQYGNMKAPISYGPEQPYGDIQIKVDGEVKLNLNGDSKRGMVKDFMKQYCRPGKGKIRLVKVR